MIIDIYNRITICCCDVWSKDKVNIVWIMSYQEIIIIKWWHMILKHWVPKCIPGMHKYRKDPLYAQIVLIKMMTEEKTEEEKRKYK